MEIRQDNFAEVHDVVEAALKRCEYFAIDLEFTGIDNDRREDDIVDSDDAVDGDVNESKADQKAAAVCRSLLAIPAEGYTKKKAVIDKYTVMQIGISTFERLPMPACEPSPAPTGTVSKAKTKQAEEVHAALAAVAHYLFQSSKTVIEVFVLPEAAEGVIPSNPVKALVDTLMDDYCTVVEMNEEVQGDAEAVSAAVLGLLRKTQTTLGSTLKSLEAKAGDGDVAALYAMECAVQMLYLYTQWVRDVPKVFQSAMDRAREKRGSSASDAGPHCPSHRAPAYQVRTFYAYLFPSPASLAFRDTTINTETMGEFMLANGIDFAKWVRDGLRFTTLGEYAAHRAAQLGEEGAVLGSDATPQQTLPGYADVYGNRLDDLFPLRVEETAYARFVLQQPPSDMRDQLVRRTRSLFLFAREAHGGGEACPTPSAGGDSAAARMPPPTSTFIADNDVNRAEGKVLRAMGIRKANKCFVPDPSYTPVARGEGGSSGFTDVSGMRGTLASASARADRAYYGAKLLSTLLTASQVWGKPLVVHNGYTDLCFLVRTLYGTLPDSYADFKTLCRRTFPVLYDTRTLTTCPALQHLGRMHGQLEKTVKEVETRAGLTAATNGDRVAREGYAWSLGEGIRPVFCSDANLAGSISTTAGSSGGDGDGGDGAMHAHNAGYDAYMTGRLFAYAKEELYLSSREESESGATTPNASPEAVLRPYKGVCPVYGSVFSVNLNDAAHDTILVPRNAPIAVAYGEQALPLMTAIQKTNGKVANLRLSLMRNDVGFTMFVCNKGLSEKSAWEGLKMAVKQVKCGPAHTSKPAADSLIMRRVPYECLLVDAEKTAEENAGSSIVRLPGI